VAPRSIAACLGPNRLAHRRGSVRVGVTLPSFRHDAAAAIDGARLAERLGLDGVFVFDHLYPMGRPDRPAISALPLLGAIAAATRRIALGPLVARVGLLPDDVLVAALRSLARIAPGRLIAGLGAGDAKGAPEQRAFGLPFEPAAQRVARLDRCVARLVAEGLEVWVGGGAPATDAVARRHGAVLNLWDASSERVAAEASVGPTSWAGGLDVAPKAAARTLRTLARAGACFAVVLWPGEDGLAVLGPLAEELRDL
jgi:alkanesulfonate monooxygenase SsuD/methylene tetrahydromethanopterin reductase-like flavin-dependent oxidoreductase (luciferase family)